MVFNAIFSDPVITVSAAAVPCCTVRTIFPSRIYLFCTFSEISQIQCQRNTMQCWDVSSMYVCVSVLDSTSPFMCEVPECVSMVTLQNT